MRVLLILCLTYGNIKIDFGWLCPRQNLIMPLKNTLYLVVFDIWGKSGITTGLEFKDFI